MIGSLRGKVLFHREDTLILDVGGVGYELVVTAAVRENLPVSTAEDLQLIVFTDVRENAISLFGFADLLEREIFLLLRRVKGIGSRLALNIISAAGSAGVLRAIAGSDVARLRQVPGIGAKTADRIIVELRSYVQEMIPADAYQTGSSPDSSPSSGKSNAKRRGLHGARRGVEDDSTSAPFQVSVDDPESDVVMALERLGFPADRARQVVRLTVERLVGDAPHTPRPESGELLRLALGNLV